MPNILLYPIVNTLKTINFTIMRTSQICPTCTTYINSLCVVYNGTYLANINTSPLNPLDTILANINTTIGVTNSSIASINTSIIATNSNVSTLTANLALKENSSNKSNDGTFNSGIPSATLFPTQSAVATYVAANIPPPGWGLTGSSGTTSGTNFIGTTDAQDVVFKANGIEYFKLSVADQSLVLSKGITSNSSSSSEIAVRSTAIITNGYVAINQNSTDKGNIQINNGDGTTKIKTLAIGGLNTVLFPNASGTIALTSQLPLYKSYVAVITQQLTTAPTVDYLLQNTLGGAVSFSYVSPGNFEATASSSLFTDQKTIVLATAGFMGVGPVIIGWYRNADSIITITSKNTSTGADENSLIYKATIEIRVYL